MGVVLVRHGEFAERGRQVGHDLDPLHGLADDGLVDDRADAHVRAPLAQFLGLQAFLVVQGHDLVALVKQPANEGLAGEPRAAGNQNLHRRLLSPPR